MAQEAPSIDVLDVVAALVGGWRSLLLVPMLVGAAAAGIAHMLPPWFTARTLILPPQQSGTGSAAASLGALAALAGATPPRSAIDQYASLLRSDTVADRLIDRFDLTTAYAARVRSNARVELAKRVRVSVGKRDGLLMIEVDDHDAHRAADMANAHVDELRRLSDRLALSEARQRRVFFEGQLMQARERLAKAQTELQATGFSQGALRAEPRAAADSYARMRAEVAAAEVRLKAMGRNLADTAPEMQQQQAMLDGLRAQLSVLERATASPTKDADYLGKYREFKLQEALVELITRQFEAARVDESRDGGTIQVVDPATVPDIRSGPRRALAGIVASIAALLGWAGFLISRYFWRVQRAVAPTRVEKFERLRAAVRRG